MTSSTRRRDRFSAAAAATVLSAVAASGSYLAYPGVLGPLLSASVVWLSIYVRKRKKHGRVDHNSPIH